jgi:hypothetical protein
MLISALTLLSIFLGPPARKPVAPAPAAGIITLKAARAQGAGATVTVRGVVLNGPELGGLRFVQDGEAGLALYSLPSRIEGYDDLQAGDSIQATGLLKNYQGLLEMDPITTVQKISGGRWQQAVKVPAAAVSSAFMEANEGRLVEITGVTRLVTTAGTEATSLAANTNYLLDGQMGALVRINLASTGPNGLVSASVPQKERFDVRGVLSQYAPTGTGGYQLLPRQVTDLVRGGGLPRIVGEPVPVSITPQGFTLEFSTIYPGDTRVQYGPSAKALAETSVNADQVSQHRIVLSDLEPGTTYYVQVSSRNAAGTATSPPVPIITGGKRRK